MRHPITLFAAAAAACLVSTGAWAADWGSWEELGQHKQVTISCRVRKRSDSKCEVQFKLENSNTQRVFASIGATLFYQGDRVGRIPDQGSYVQPGGDYKFVPDLIDSPNVDNVKWSLNVRFE